MTFWQENYAFIKDVYDMRHQKMAEWMENVEKVVLFSHWACIPAFSLLEEKKDPDSRPENFEPKNIEICQQKSKIWTRTERNRMQLSAVGITKDN